MTVLTTSPPMRFLLRRLRASIASDTRFSDADVLSILNAGYNDLVEQSRYLRAAQSFDLVAGQQEYGLPNACAILRVYVAGVRQIPVALDAAATQMSGPYYYYLDQSIGFVTVPDGSQGKAWIYYATRPAPLGLDDVPVIPPEFYYLLRHYAAWRILLLQSGAARIPEALRQRAIFDAGIHALRSEQIIEVAPRRLTSVQQTQGSSGRPLRPAGQGIDVSR